MKEKYTLNDLLQIENALKIICIKYEIVSKNNNGVIIDNDEYKNFKKFNDFRNKIISKIEEKLTEEIKNIYDGKN